MQIIFKHITLTNSIIPLPMHENASTHDLWKIEQNSIEIIETQAIFITTDHTFIKNISIQKIQLF